MKNFWNPNETWDMCINSTKPTQLEYYKSKNSCERILKMVALDSKRFGSIAEKIICKVLSLEPAKNTQHDAIRKEKKIEIKTARYWINSDDCKWQHLEENHDYEFVLFALLHFDCFKVWIIKKRTLIGECKDKNILKKQGNQGWWCNKNAILNYLTPINSVDDLDKFIL